MTTLKLNTSAPVSVPIKWRWCMSSRRSVPSAPATIRRCISGISINRSRAPRRWRWLTTAERTIWIKHDELIVGNRASEVRAAPIFPEYTVSWIEKEIDDLADRPGAASRSARRINAYCMKCAHGGAARPYRTAATVCSPMSKGAARHRHY